MLLTLKGSWKRRYFVLAISFWKTFFGILPSVLKSVFFKPLILFHIVCIFLLCLMLKIYLYCCQSSNYLSSARYVPFVSIYSDQSGYPEWSASKNDTVCYKLSHLNCYYIGRAEASRALWKLQSFQVLLSFRAAFAEMCILSSKQQKISIYIKTIKSQLEVIALFGCDGRQAW